ncbi:hypothetical protein HY409_03055 [Candidatus Gottesmanbacteria bacterium]|nr:hypothetical protein [Candidatus Gottesmanbacteria bacterium]
MGEPGGEYKPNLDDFDPKNPDTWMKEVETPDGMVSVPVHVAQEMQAGVTYELDPKGDATAE